MNENGSEMKVECSTCVQLLERRSTCRHWSEHKEIDTFDKVPHKRLLSKLRSYRIDNSIVEWIKRPKTKSESKW